MVCLILHVCLPSTLKSGESDLNYIQVEITYGNLCGSIAQLTNNKTIYDECRQKIKVRFEDRME